MNYDKTKKLVSELVKLDTAEIKSLKCLGDNQNTLNGLDPATSVFRIKTLEKSFILKGYISSAMYRFERDNLLFLKQCVPQHIPSLVLSLDDDKTIVMEDVGDIAPIATNSENDTNELILVWKNIISSIAKIHDVVLKSYNLKNQACNKQSIQRQFVRPNDLIKAVQIATVKWRGYYILDHEINRLYAGIKKIIRELQNYKDTTHEYAMGERSCANIRLYNRQIYHIDHCSLAHWIPHVDLVSIWLSSKRDMLLDWYIHERSVLDNGFDSNQFRHIDHYFTIYNCLIWMVIKTGTWSDLKVRPLTSIDNVNKSVTTNLEIAIAAALKIPLPSLAEIFQKLYIIWSRR